MAERPFVIGLTGSIGMGKSETARMFARLGVPVHDADATVHALYDKGGLAVAAIADAFPEAVKDGAVDRAALARRVSGDEAAMRRLEALVHPLVVRERGEFLAGAAKAGARFVLFDIPLLFETGREKDVDAVVVVSAPHEVQRARVLARPDMSEERFAAIHARQVSDAEKRAKADFVIETGEGLDHAFVQVKQVMAELERRPRPAGDKAKP
jgi:dephospho-CoA kinase